MWTRRRTAGEFAPALCAGQRPQHFSRRRRVRAAGGLIGWTLSLVPFLAFGATLADQAAARIARLMSAAILALWGLNAAMRAFGL